MSKSTDAVDQNIDAAISCIEQLKKRLDIQMTALDGALVYSDQYLRPISGSDTRTMFIKSALGTGKTQQISALREQLGGNCVIVSHRITFTNSMKSRYSGLISYQDIKGAIDFSNSSTVAIQIDSLARLSESAAVDILILDEWESLLSQL